MEGSDDLDAAGDHGSDKAGPSSRAQRIASRCNTSNIGSGSSRGRKPVRKAGKSGGGDGGDSDDSYDAGAASDSDASLSDEDGGAADDASEDDVSEMSDLDGMDVDEHLRGGNDDSEEAMCALCSLRDRWSGTAAFDSLCHFLCTHNRQVCCVISHAHRLCVHHTGATSPMCLES